MLPRTDSLPSLLHIDDVTVIDVKGGPPLAASLVLSCTGIVFWRSSAPKNARRRIASSAFLVDGKGKFLIPGLWDMHVHMVFGDWFPRGKGSDDTAVHRQRNHSACAIWVANSKCCSSGGRRYRRNADWTAHRDVGADARRAAAALSQFDRDQDAGGRTSRRRRPEAARR